MIWWLLLVCLWRVMGVGETSTAAVTNPLHVWCLSYREWRELPQLYNGLICGSKDIGTPLTTLFQSVGLYHVMVVSGSHLIFIDRYINRFLAHVPVANKNVFYKLITRGTALSLYSYMCLLNAPVLRALFGLLCQHLSSRWTLSLKSDQLILASGLLTLIVFPDWILSLSLQLSWVAALCMSLAVSGPVKACLCLLYIAPLLGAQSPLFAINNILFLVAFDVLYFPLTALTFLIPGSTWIANLSWSIALEALRQLPATPVNAVDFGDVASGWLIVFALHLVHFWIRR